MFQYISYNRIAILYQNDFFHFQIAPIRGADHFKHTVPLTHTNE